MNNLSAFTDVINGVRHAIVALNSQFIQMRSQLDELKNQEGQQVNLDEIKGTLTSFQTSTESKVSLLVADIDQLKQTVADVEIKLSSCICNCSSQTTTPSITEADVQQMIDISISQLLEGVTNQPLPPLGDVVNETNLDDIQAPLVVVEPPNITDTVPEPVSPVPTLPTTPAKAKRSYKKKA
jgi:hypothetical protein